MGGLCSSPTDRLLPLRLPQLLPVNSSCSWLWMDEKRPQCSPPFAHVVPLPPPPRASSPAMCARTGLIVCNNLFNRGINATRARGCALPPPYPISLLLQGTPTCSSGGSSPCSPPCSSCLSELGHNKSQSLQRCAVGLVNIYPHGAGLRSPEPVQPGGSRPHGVLPPSVPWVTSPPSPSPSLVPCLLSRSLALGAGSCPMDGDPIGMGGSGRGQWEH